MRWLVPVQLLLGMGLFGSSTPISKIIGEDFPVFSASLLRVLIAGTVLAPFVFLTRRRELTGLHRRDMLVVMAIALAGMVGFTASQLFGMRHTTGVIGATVMSTAPAVTALAAVLFLGARLTWRKALALGLGVSGVMSINLLRGSNGAGPGEALVLGTLLIVLAVCFEAAYTLLSKQLSDDISSLTATFLASWVAVPAFVLFALLFDGAPFDYSRGDARSWSAVLFWGAATGGLAPVLWYNGVRRASGVFAAAFMAVMPVSGLVLSYVLLGEPFRWQQLIGFGLVFSGLVLMIFVHAGEAAREAD